MSGMNNETRRVFHPFSPFVPPVCTSLLLGSFPGSRSTGDEAPADDWYYGASGNQFWPIMKVVFPGRALDSRQGRMALFAEMGMAVSDIILSCIRLRGSNQDRNLVERTYNTGAVEEILSAHPVKRIFFTGKGVEREFLKHFRCPQGVARITLPSPSPAYFRMSKEEKAKRYMQEFRRTGLLPPARKPFLSP